MVDAKYENIAKKESKTKKVKVDEVNDPKVDKNYDKRGNDVKKIVDKNHDNFGHGWNQRKNRKTQEVERKLAWW